MKNKSKKIILVIGITILLIALGIVLPIIVKGDNNNATAGEVLSGKTFTNGSAVAIAGTMADYSDTIKEFTATVEATDEDYIATIDLDDGYYESVKINAKPIYDRGALDGVGNLTRLTSSNFSGTHSSTTAGAASTYTVKSTSAGYVENNTTVNTLTAETSPTIATTSATGTQTIAVKPGYYNNISVNQTNAYNKGVSDGRTVGTGLKSQSITVTCTATHGTGNDVKRSKTTTGTFSNLTKIVGFSAITENRYQGDTNCVVVPHPTGYSINGNKVTVTYQYTERNNSAWGPQNTTITITAVGY